LYVEGGQVDSPPRWAAGYSQREQIGPASEILRERVCSTVDAGTLSGASLYYVSAICKCRICMQKMRRGFGYVGQANFGALRCRVRIALGVRMQTSSNATPQCNMYRLSGPVWTHLPSSSLLSPLYFVSPVAWWAMASAFAAPRLVFSPCLPFYRTH
jgi:hypothetical protein